jgi:glycosyltransferase involved in cell wall biosynthesis
MTIIFLCNEYPPHAHGGTGIFVKTLAEFLAKNHDVIVIGAYEKAGDISVSQVQGVTVYEFPVKPDKIKTNFILNRIRFARFVNKIAGQNRVDVIEGFDTNSWFLFFSKKRPLFIRLHNGERYTQKMRGKFVELFERLSFLRRDHYIAVSEVLKEKFVEHFKINANRSRRDVSVIYNGIQLDNFPLAPESEVARNKIVFVGTLKHVKGVDVLIEAFLTLAKDNDNFELAIIGPDSMDKGGYKNYLISNFGLENLIEKGRLNFYGKLERADINTHLSRALVCVVPSRFESFGLVTVEAMACFVPVICSRAGASEEIVEDGKSGFLVQPGNAAEIGEIISGLYAGRWDRDSIIKRARQTVEEHFTVAICAKKTLELYEEKLRRDKEY